MKNLHLEPLRAFLFASLITAGDVFLTNGDYTEV